MRGAVVSLSLAVMSLTVISMVNDYSQLQEQERLTEENRLLKVEGELRLRSSSLSLLETRVRLLEVKRGHGPSHAEAPETVRLPYPE